MQRTFLMIKPDAVRRGLIGEIVGRFESKGFRMAAGKLMRIPESLAQKHYQEHAGKSFYHDLISFITSGPVFAMVWEGENVISVSRTMMGATDPKKALPGTIRGDFATLVEENVIHGSDSPESAAREINLFFSEDELIHD